MVDDLKKTLPGHSLVQIAPDQGKRFPVGRSSEELSRQDRAVPQSVDGKESLASAPDFHYFTGLARYQSGMTDSAIMHFQQAIMCGTSKVSCLLMIARCQMKKGNFPEAKRCLVTGLSQEGISQIYFLVIS